MNHFIVEECKEKDLDQLLLLMKSYREFYQVDTIEDQRLYLFFKIFYTVNMQVHFSFVRQEEIKW